MANSSWPRWVYSGQLALGWAEALTRLDRLQEDMIALGQVELRKAYRTGMGEIQYRRAVGL